MGFFEKKSRLDVPAKEVFQWQARPATFKRLTPPWEKMGGIGKKIVGAKNPREMLEVKEGHFRRRWVAIQDPAVGETPFVDELVQGPFPKWFHTHQILPEAGATSSLRDRIEYRPFGWFLGEWVAGAWMRRQLDHLFSFRHARAQNDLKRYHPYASRPPLKIVVGGASGLIGTALTNFLSCAGNQVQVLVRRPPQLESPEIFWDPSRHQLDKAALESQDAVIHLGGENIGAKRWTPRQKEILFTSRVEGTRFLAQTLASLRHPPKVLVCASATGYYGDRGEEALTEESGPGEGFLPELCKAWEEVLEPARKAGIRVVSVRTGIVLTPRGGALSRILLPFKMGLGGPIGPGNQWMSWISLEDLVGIFHYLINEPGLSGPVNATAPNAVTSKSFAQVLGKVLKRPAFLPLPAFVVKSMFGEMGKALLLEGQRVQPAKLEASGFSFLLPDLESALRWELGR